MRAQCGVDGRPAVGIVATLRDWKGHDDLLDAWLLLRERVPGWQLLVIGDGPRRAHLEGRVAALGLAHDVRFTGNQDDVPAWFACAAIATLPSYGDEGVPQSLMQAAACGLPAVTTPIGAIKEAVVDGQTGLLVAPRSPPALAAALERLMTDADLRARMGAAAHAYAQANFGIDRMLDAMEAVFARVAGGRG
jgi:glycosyltransferase involved in cell wall biosynthesis